MKPERSAAPLPQAFQPAPQPLDAGPQPSNKTGTEAQAADAGEHTWGHRHRSSLQAKKWRGWSGRRDDWRASSKGRVSARSEARSQPTTTGELCEHFAAYDRCTVMQHLKVLEDADLVIARREGRQRWNYLNVLPVKEIYDRWISQYAEPSVGLLARLKKALEE